MSCDKGNHIKACLIQEGGIIGYHSYKTITLKLWWCERCELVWGEVITTDAQTGETTSSTEPQVTSNV